MSWGRLFQMWGPKCEKLWKPWVLQSKLWSLIMHVSEEERRELVWRGDLWESVWQALPTCMANCFCIYYLLVGKCMANPTPPHHLQSSATASNTLSQDAALQNPTTPGEPPGTLTTSPTTFHPTRQHIDRWPSFLTPSQSGAVFPKKWPQHPPLAPSRPGSAPY